MDRTRLTAPRPQRGAGGVWTRRKSAAPTVTLETKLVALRAMVGAERTRAEAAFVAEAMPFLRTICRWYSGPDLATEDLEAEALLALYEAMGTWAPGGRPFDTYARWGVRMALAKMLRASRMIRGRGRTGRVVIGSALHGMDNDRGSPRSLGANVPELATALTDMAGSETGMVERCGEAEREAECAALAEAVAALSDADRATVAAWQAGTVRALPRALRDRLREAVS